MLKNWTIGNTSELEILDGVLTSVSATSNITYNNYTTLNQYLEIGIVDDNSEFTFNAFLRANFIGNINIQHSYWFQYNNGTNWEIWYEGENDNEYFLDSYENYKDLENASDYEFLNGDVIRIECINNMLENRYRILKNNILISEKTVKDEYDLSEEELTSSNKNIWIEFNDKGGFEFIRVGSNLHKDDYDKYLIPLVGFGDDFGTF